MTLIQTRAVRNEPVKSLPRLEMGDRLDQATFHARYEQMPRGIKAELIGGIVYMPSPLGYAHGSADASIVGWLAFYAVKTPGVRAVSNATTILADDSEPQPDAALRVVAGGQSTTQLFGDLEYIVGAPELLIEVSTTTESYDLHQKLNDYERYGAREYLVLLPRESRVILFVREHEKLVQIPADADGIVRSRFFPGLWLDPVALFRGDLAWLDEIIRQGISQTDHAAFVASIAQK